MAVIKDIFRAAFHKRDKTVMRKNIGDLIRSGRLHIFIIGVLNDLISR